MFMQVNDNKFKLYYKKKIPMGINSTTTFAQLAYTCICTLGMPKEIMEVVDQGHTLLDDL